MSKYHKILVLAVSLIALVNIASAIGSTAAPRSKQFVQFLPQQDEQDTKNAPLQLDIKERENGTLLIITFNGAKITLDKEAAPVPPGGIYTVSLDASIVLQGTFDEPTIKIEKPLSLQTLTNGEHLVRCELHYSIGETYKAELPFSFDATPIISLGKNNSKLTAFDPLVGFKFYKEDQKNVGFIDVAIDERSLGVAEIQAQANGETKLLSQWLGKTISVAELPPGQHLLGLTATGTNGGESVQFIPFTVEALPILNVEKNKDGTMERIKATFLQANNAYSGSVDVFYRHGVILSLQSRETSVLIEKSHILQAFAQHKLQLPTIPTPLVVSLRSANNTENWQTILFLP